HNSDIDDQTITSIFEIITNNMLCIEKFTLDLAGDKALKTPILDFLAPATLKTLRINLNSCNNLINPCISCQSLGQLEECELDFHNCSNMIGFDSKMPEPLRKLSLNCVGTCLDDTFVKVLTENINSQLQMLESLVIDFSECSKLSSPILSLNNLLY